MNTKKPKKGELISYESFLDAQLREPEAAREYLKAALADGSPEVFKMAVRDVVRTLENKSHFAQKAGLSRQTVHKMGRGEGDLSFDTLARVLSALGSRFDIAAKASSGRLGHHHSPA